jgi:hypothetical protein
MSMSLGKRETRRLMVFENNAVRETMDMEKKQHEYGDHLS